ncbi:MAG: hypothetical protein AB8G23_09910 [Myxococcota bacterium]
MRSFRPLFIALFLLLAWFAYDGWVSQDPEASVHRDFNRVGTLFLLVPTILAGRSAFSSQAFEANDSDAVEVENQWNFGAFVLTPIWGLGNRVYWSLLALVPILGFAVQIYAGLKGYKAARDSFPWQSDEEFEQAQRLWNRWGIGVGIFSLVVYSLLFLATID